MKNDEARLRDRLQRLSDALKGSGESGLSCEACRADFPACVEAELAGEQVATRFPAVWHHLLTCDECSALYADLIEVSELEEMGRLPVPSAIPAPDLSFLPSRATALRPWVQKIAESITARMMPGALPDLSTLCEAFFERAEALGGAFRVSSTAELALAFGTEASPALPVLAATFSTTQAVLSMWGAPEHQAPAARLAGKLERLARDEALRIGLNRVQAKAFASAYVQAAQEHRFGE